MKKQVVIILAPPGSGKGTQSTLLSDKLGLHYFETSKILEQAFANQAQEFIEAEGKKYYKKDEEKLWQEGILCSPPFVTVLVQEKIKKLFKAGEGIIFAGSPRTLYEGERIIPLLKELYSQENIKAVLIKLSAKESIFRNSHRRICELMRHPILYTKETAELDKCPLDGSKLVKRKGLDDPETIKVRLKEFKDRTFPLVDFFKKQGLEIKEVNGEQPVADVFNDILKALK